MATPTLHHGPMLNEFLAALPSRELQRIEPWLESVNLKRGQILWEAGDMRNHIYFPTTAMIYLIYETDNGSSSEVGMIGRRGIAGINTVTGGAEELARAVVEREGIAFRMKASKVREEFEQSGDFQDLMLCFTQSLINQLSLTSVCNRLHSVEQQLCRWLLRNHDNQQNPIFTATHSQIGNIIGVRRESISVAVSRLEGQGLINGSRGKIEILDRKGLEITACECYIRLKNLHDKMIANYALSHGS